MQKAILRDLHIFYCQVCSTETIINTGLGYAGQCTIMYELQRLFLTRSHRQKSDDVKVSVKDLKQIILSEVAAVATQVKNQVVILTLNMGQRKDGFI